ncbi:MAG: hypothetical protein IKB89_02875, partial [Clostridia bacterium]|nr:hypothetical protein [Clostridia bacterium]
MKKFFSIMLALVMVLGIMSVGTMAADPIVFEDFDDYASATAAKTNWSTVNALADDGNGGKALQVNIGSSATNANTYFKGTNNAPEGLYDLTFRVKTEREYEGAKVEVMTANSAANIIAVAVPSTEWTTVTIPTYWDSAYALRFKIYGPSGSAQKYFFDDIVLNPYTGGNLLGAYSSFDDAEEITTNTGNWNFASGDADRFVAAGTETTDGKVSYATGADGTGYSLKLDGSGEVFGVRKTQIFVPSGETLKLSYKLKSNLPATDIIRFDISGMFTLNNPGEGTEAVQVSTEGWEEKELIIETTGTTNIITLSVRATADLVAGYDAYIDDIVLCKYTAPPVVEPTEYDVTITAGANANASVSAATSEGEAVNFTVAPKFGYYIQSITI